MSDQFMSVQMVSQLELPVTSLAKTESHFFVHLGLGHFFVLSL